MQACFSELFTTLGAAEALLSGLVIFVGCVVAVLIYLDLKRAKR